MSKVGVIGLSAVGIGIALHLVSKSFAVTGFDIDPKAIETFKSKGGNAATTARECVSGADVVLILTNAEQTQTALYTESTGAVWGLKQDATILLCSVLPPGFPVQVQALLHGEYKRTDINVADCPVWGSAEDAAKGRLRIVNSGWAGKKGDSVLCSMISSMITISTGLGTANKRKMIDQQLVGIHIAVAAEAMSFAVALGLDTKAVHDSVIKSSANSQVFEDRVPHMLANDWTPKFTLDESVENMAMIVNEARKHKIPMFLTSIAQQFYLLAGQMGYGKEDDSGIVRVFSPKDSVSASVSKGHKDASAIQPIQDLLEIVHAFAGAEAVALSKGIQLDLHNMVDGVANGFGDSKSFLRVQALAVHFGYDKTGRKVADLCAKLETILHLADQKRHALPLTSSVYQIYLKAEQDHPNWHEVDLFTLWPEHK